MSSFVWCDRSTDYPDACLVACHPARFANPSLLVQSPLLAQLGFHALSSSDVLTELLGQGQSRPYAMAYAGHQYGRFVQLGDGRAHTIGSCCWQHQLVDVTLKGSGPTPFSRGGDGWAALGPMCREYLICEAMHALGVPTTRVLAVIKTGQSVQRETIQSGAVLVRMMRCALRVGSFEHLAARGDWSALQQLVHLAMKRHDPESLKASQPMVAWLQQVVQRQIETLVHWQRVGFVHGVMNTDNMLICGETIDYGPCAFLDHYNPNQVYSSIDRHGRYAFSQQPTIGQWNLARLAEAICPCVDASTQTALSDVIDAYPQQYQAAWLTMMCNKLGLRNCRSDDADLVTQLLDQMAVHRLDYTETFAQLSTLPYAELQSKMPVLKQWIKAWQHRCQIQPDGLPDRAMMRRTNPMVIPRNHQVESALTSIDEDPSAWQALLAVVQAPYADHLSSRYRLPPRPEQCVHQTFCGT